MNDGVGATSGWQLDALHTFYSRFSATCRCLSIPLGETLEALYPTECGVLPMFGASQAFEYPSAWVGAGDAASATPPSSVPSSPRQVPVVGAGVWASLQQEST